MTIDAFGNFVALDPVRDAQRITHYRASPDNPQVVHITLVVDDEGLYYDDPPVANDPSNGNFTVWEFEIDPPYIDELPQFDKTYTFTATIRPDVDHNGKSMARTIEFRLVSSNEPGYCLNATRVEGKWTDTTGEDNDLKFVPNQPGLEVFAEGPNPTNYSVARTTKPQLSALVKVQCLDYGAFGSVWAYAYGLGIDGFEKVPARWKGMLVAQGAQIPLDQRDGLDNDGDGRVDEDLIDGQDNDKDGMVDEDAVGNYIYDGWQWNHGAATDDNDPVNQIPPANQPD